MKAGRLVEGDTLVALDAGVEVGLVDDAIAVEDEDVL